MTSTLIRINHHRSTLQMIHSKTRITIPNLIMMGRLILIKLETRPTSISRMDHHFQAMIHRRISIILEMTIIRHNKQDKPPLQIPKTISNSINLKQEKRNLNMFKERILIEKLARLKTLMILNSMKIREMLLTSSCHQSL